jgi:hypothetical protein
LSLSFETVYAGEPYIGLHSIYLLSCFIVTLWLLFVTISKFVFRNKNMAL